MGAMPPPARYCAAGTGRASSLSSTASGGLLAFLPRPLSYLRRGHPSARVEAMAGRGGVMVDEAGNHHQIPQRHASARRTAPFAYVTGPPVEDDEYTIEIPRPFFIPENTPPEVVLGGLGVAVGVVGYQGVRMAKKAIAKSSGEVEEAPAEPVAKKAGVYAGFGQQMRERREMVQKAAAIAEARVEEEESDRVEELMDFETSVEKRLAEEAIKRMQEQTAAAAVAAPAEMETEEAEAEASGAIADAEAELAEAEAEALAAQLELKETMGSMDLTGDALDEELLRDLEAAQKELEAAQAEASEARKEIEAMEGEKSGTIKVSAADRVAPTPEATPAKEEKKEGMFGGIFDKKEKKKEEEEEEKKKEEGEEEEEAKAVITPPLPVEEVKEEPKVV
eukprot:CAMPEP_0182880976 /NCGR_PEP_ID=MMETSP0034_2-20130328/16897_1 /TAXON_ID=156128 /ORGANISM="Nephroselmis pyriformis, Strain CCMP717" /LENGTH=392 /DNA_ID=CAMNT_0025013987 /DNA_START=30 /DNA_END=1205 /DNA_ORIENTATION=+